MIEAATPIELEPLDFVDLKFLAACYEYLGDGKFTTEYRVWGFANAVQRMLAEKNDIVIKPPASAASADLHTSSGQPSG